MAWIEGWADFLPLAVQDDPVFEHIGEFSFNLETPTWGSSGWDSGDAVEGRVAGTLYDILDNNCDGFDNFYLDFSPIWDTISNQKDNNFREFYDGWLSRGHDNAAFLATTYQNTITYGYPNSPITFTLNLIKGWNMISFPVASENDTPDNIFENVTYYMAYYDPVWGYMPAPPDEPVDLGVGYWVKISDNTTVTTSGVMVENFSIDFVEGWNLVGFPQTSADTTPKNLFENVSYNMFYYDPEWGYLGWHENLPVQPGMGYWVNVDNDMTVTVPL